MSYLRTRGLEPTAIQDAAFETLPDGDDALFVAPTGSGKTLAAMLPLLSYLLEVPRTKPGVRLVYIAPVRALVSQQGANLALVAQQLAMGTGATLSVRVRTGDTSARERRAITASPPDVLVLTPESLALMLGTKARATLETVTQVVLDETHLLATGKRGALLASTLETLGWVTTRAGGSRPRRVGLSATVNPIAAFARWLGGSERSARTTVVGDAPALDVELIAPSMDAPFPSAGWTGRAMLPAVARAIARCAGTTLVFVHSRPRAEQWTQALRDVLPSRMDIACFHGSMAADERGLVAQRLGAGELRAVVTTSSLEVGVDIPSAEQVVVIAAPASITQLLQSGGRSHHRPDGIAVARIAPSNALDLVTAIAATRCAARGEIEPVRLRDGALDVATQAVLALCAAGPIGMDAIAHTLHRAAPFASLTDVALREIVDHLETGGATLEAYSEARRIEATAAGYVLAGTRSERAYLRGVGTIMDEPAVAVRMGGRRIGHVDGQFAATLSIGDRFALAGSNWRLIAMNAEALEVTRERSHAQRVARWSGQRPSQSEILTDEVRRLFGEIDARVPPAARDDPGLRYETIEKIAEMLALEPANARAVVRLVLAQREDSAMPTPARCVVEVVSETARVHVVVHTFAGVMANEVIGRVVGARIRRASGRGTQIATTDMSVAITVAQAPAELGDERALRALFDPSDLHRDLAETLEGSALARASFREVARISQLSTDRGRPGAASPGLLYDVLRKHARKHVLLRALDQTVWSSLDGARAERVLDWMLSAAWHVARVREPTVLAIQVFLTSLSRENLGPEDMESALVAAAHAMYLRHGAAELP